MRIWLSGHLPEIQAGVEVVKIKNPDFSCWAGSTPWEHVLSLKSFCQNPVLSWAIRYSVFQPIKFSSSFEFVCHTIFSTFWHLVVKFGYSKWFLSNKKVASSFCKVLVNLTGWKTELLIAQLRAGTWRKVFRLKTCSQGVLPAQ